MITALTIAALAALAIPTALRLLHRLAGVVIDRAIKRAHADPEFHQHCGAYDPREHGQHIALGLPYPPAEGQDGADQR